MCREDGPAQPMAEAGPREVRNLADGKTEGHVAISLSAFGSATNTEPSTQTSPGLPLGLVPVVETVDHPYSSEQSSPVVRTRIEAGLAAFQNPLSGLKNAANNLSEGLRTGASIASPLTGLVNNVNPFSGLLGKSGSSRQLSRRNIKLSFPDQDGDDAVKFVQGTRESAGTLLKWCRTGCLSYSPKKIVHKFWVESESLRWNTHKTVAKNAKGCVGRIPLASVISVTAFVLDTEGVDETDQEDIHKSGQSQRSNFSSCRKGSWQRWLAGSGSMILGWRPDLEFEIFYRREDMKFKHEKMYLRARSRRELKLWVTGLQQLMLTRLQSARNMNIDAMSRDLFRQADTNDDGRLQWFEVRKVLERLGASSMHLTEWNRHVFFKKYDKDADGEINEDEFVCLYRDLMTRKVLRRYFDEYASEETFADYIENINIVEDTMGNCRLLTTTQLCRFFREVQAERDADPVSVQEVLDNIRKLPGAEYAVHASMCAITEIGLSIFMCSDFNRLIDPHKASLHQDMTQPLSRYFINSSHNTYLENRQFGGKASTSQYIDVLRRGCRCVEIDCWDGSDGEPVVTHGYASRPLIKFKDVIRVCRDHAFEHSEFPLIISIEMRCGAEQKGRCGKIMETLLGDMLFRMPPCGLDTAPLCSPELARRKIIIKAKPVGINEDDSDSDDDGEYNGNISNDKDVPDNVTLPQQICPNITRTSSQGTCTHFSSARSSDIVLEDDDLFIGHDSAPLGPASTSGGLSSMSKDTGSEPFFTSEFSDMERESSSASPVPSPQRRAGKTKTSRSRSVPSNGTSSEQSGAQNTRASIRRVSIRNMWNNFAGRGKDRKHSKQKTNSRISKFVDGLVEYNKVIYLHAMKFPINENRPLEEGRHPCNISSLKEAKMRTKLRKYGSSMNEYHEDNLTRVYPAVWHSNFPPLIHWWHGTQLVALNYQNFGDVMLINEGMFRHQNGGFGYVLKPEAVRPKKGNRPVDAQKNAMELRLRIMSGHFLPKAAKSTGAISPSVRVTIRGLDTDAAAFETSAQQENGFDPCWDDLDMDFNVTQPDMAFLCFYVNDNSPKTAPVTVAVAAYPVNMLREGVRWVPLWDMRHNDIENCGLLVKIATRRRKNDQGPDTIQEETTEGEMDDITEGVETPLPSPFAGKFFLDAEDTQDSMEPSLPNERGETLQRDSPDDELIDRKEAALRRGLSKFSL